MSFYIENKSVGDAANSEDWRIRGYNPLTPPDLLQSEIPQSAKSRETVLNGRNETVAVVQGKDANGRLSSSCARTWRSRAQQWDGRA
jgi:3-deoxy-7-phosphoheptulonate synthase